MYLGKSETEIFIFQLRGDTDIMTVKQNMKSA